MLDQTKFVSSLIAFCDKDCNPNLNLDGECNGSCFQICPRVCKHLCIDGNLFPPLPVTQPIPKPRPLLVPQSPPLILPNPLYEAGNSAQKHIITTSVIIMGSLIGAAILFCIIATIFKFKHRFSTRSRNHPPLFFGTQEDFLDEDQGPQIDHPIWYINTIGLQQSVIDSIAIFKYKKDEGLIEGTECSVCLNEFQENECLRLLPKCSHAFHLPCIDTWLRSHKNCPLCRAPIIVSNNFDVLVELPVLTTTSSENSTSNQVGEDDGSSEEGLNGDDMNVHTFSIEDETNGENSKTGSNFVSRNHFRVQSDLVGSRQVVETEMQPIRRSASLDLSSAMEIYYSIANQENLVQLKHSKSKNVSKRGSNGSISFRKLMQSSSIGHALQKAPISMKRSFSSSGKSSSSSSRHSRSQDSILPV